MKKVAMVALAAMFTVSVMAQTQDKAKPAEKKAEPAKTETAKPATKETAKPATKETAKPAPKDAAKQVAKPAKKTEEAKPAK